MQLFVRGPSAGGPLLRVEASPEDLVASLVATAADGPSTSAPADVRVVCGGRTLDPRRTLAAARVAPGATLDLLPRLRGGGGDGGSTGAESRSCYLEMYLGKKPDKVNPEEERLARWTTCQLSSMPLAPPCVADELGNLFNKDAVLQALVGKSMPPALGHVSGLKHVFDLQLHADPAAGGGGSSRQGAGDGGARSVRFSCPVTGAPMGGKGRFVAFRRGGMVVSERALKEVPAVVEEMAGGKWAAEDLVPLNPPAEELAQRREALLAARAAARAAKKERRRDKAGVAANGGAVHADGDDAEHTGAKRAAAENGAGAGAAASAAAALYGGEAARNGGGAPTAAAAKKFKATELKPAGADDKVWSSIFTSSRGEQGPKNDFLSRGSSRMRTAA
eukprot:scaffold6.g2780.t1